MADYQATSNNSLTFELTQGDNLIGRLSYKSWFKFDASITIANKATYQIEPKGFWGTTIELKDNDKVLLKFSMNWNGEIGIQTYFTDTENGYIVKHRGIFKDSFILIDRDGAELLVMKPHLKWTSMNYSYQIQTADRFESFSTKDLLLLTSLHCANYYMTMLTTTGIGA